MGCVVHYLKINWSPIKSAIFFTVFVAILTLQQAVELLSVGGLHDNAVCLKLLVHSIHNLYVVCQRREYVLLKMTGRVVHLMCSVFFFYPFGSSSYISRLTQPIIVTQ
jgi:hypothetical protein